MSILFRNRSCCRPSFLQTKPCLPNKRVSPLMLSIYDISSPVNTEHLRVIRTERHRLPHSTAPSGGNYLREWRARRPSAPHSTLTQLRARKINSVRESIPGWSRMLITVQTRLFHCRGGTCGQALRDHFSIQKASVLSRALLPQAAKGLQVRSFLVAYLMQHVTGFLVVGLL
jgi:hypothetical protein